MTIAIGINATLNIAGTKIKISNMRTKMSIVDRYFMKSLKAGNTSRPAPLNIPHKPMTRITIFWDRLSSLRMLAQDPIKTKPADMFKNI